MSNDIDYTNVEYLGITEAADYLRVSASTLRRWEKKGFLIPERTPTGIRRYTKQQLDDVIQAPPEYGHQYSTSSTPSHQQVEHSIGTIHTEPQPSFSVATTEYPTPQEQPSVVPASHIESLHDLDDIRDFFKKAGYSFDEEMQSSSQASTMPITNHQSPTLDEPAQSSSYEPLSLEDITHERERVDMSQQSAHQNYPNVHQNSSPVSRSTSNTELHPSLESIALPEMPQLPQFEHAPIPTTPLDDSPESLRTSEVFHEEHSATFLDYMRKDREKRTQQTYSPQTEPSTTQPQTYAPVSPTQSQGDTGKTESTHTAPHTKKSVRSIAVVIVGIIVVLVVVFIGWSLYSYLSTPPDLYNPVVD